MSGRLSVSSRSSRHECGMDPVHSGNGTGTGTGHYHDIGDEDENWQEEFSDEEETDFKQRIHDMQHRAHMEGVSVDGRDADSDEFGFDHPTFDEDTMGEDKFHHPKETPNTATDTSVWKAEEWRERTRQFSTVVWEWSDTGIQSSDTASTTSHHVPSASIVSTLSSSSTSSEARMASLSLSETEPSTTTNANSSSSNSTPNTLLSTTTTTTTHHQPHHHHHHSSTAGIGRNLSLDSSARALGLNIVYVERLALPLLRSEIHNFFAKLLVRVESLLHTLETHPIRVLEKMLAGMRSNSSGTQDEELRRNFEASARRMQTQIDEIRAADPTSPQPYTSPPSTLSPSPPSASVPLSSPLAVYGSPSPSPSLSLSPTASFLPPSWWPQSLCTSHASLVKVRELFHMFSVGFDDSASTTGDGRSSTSKYQPTGSPPNRTASSLLSASSSSPSPSPSMRSRPPQLHRLEALPTTNSNREGLALLARLLQSFSMVVAFEGGQIMAASKLALAFQRMANTLLEKHRVEEKSWVK